MCELRRFRFSAGSQDLKEVLLGCQLLQVLLLQLLQFPEEVLLLIRLLLVLKGLRIGIVGAPLV